MTSGEGSITNRDLYDESRRRLNEKSREWGQARYQVPWTAEEDEVILNQWALVEASRRDDMAISRQLGRTLFSCQARAEGLRQKLGISTPVSSRSGQEAASQPVCDGCHMELPATNECDNCA